MKSVLVLAVSLLSVSVFADIPVMGHNESKAQISGSAAQAVFDSINQAEQLEGAGILGMTVSKAMRAEDGLSQVVCHKTTVRDESKPATYRCDTSVSNDGKALPPYVAPHRMG